MTQEQITKIKSIFAQKLRKLLDENKMTQVELSQTLGVSESTVGKWLLQKSIPRMNIIEKLSLVFACPTSYFLNEEDNRRTCYLTDEETLLIKKYRQLDADGKDRINRQLDFELYQINQSAEKEERNLG